MPERFHPRLLTLALLVAIVGSILVAVSQGRLFMAVPYGIVATFVAFGLWLFIIHPQLSKQDIELIDHVALGVLLLLGVVMGLVISLSVGGNVIAGIGGGMVVGFIAWGCMHIVNYWY